LCCVELTGPEESLLGGLAQITGSGGKMGQSFDSPIYLDGRREGFAWIYHPNKYPYRAVGKVSFLWKPWKDKSQTRTVWIWSHPGFYEEFLTVLRSAFSLEEKQREGEAEEPSNKKLKFSDPILEQKLAAKNIDVDKIPVWRGRFREGEVTVKLLKDTLNRFRLVGPMSKTVLKNSLRLANLEDRLEDDGAVWWKNFADSITLEREFWSHFDQFSEFPNGLAFGLIVRDPRKVLPPKRGCALMPSKGNKSLFGAYSQLIR